MWQLIALALASGPAAADDTSNIKGHAFGPSIILTCTWFSNFENSQFRQCRSETGEMLLADERASVECSAETCEVLDAEARRVAQWRKPGPLWGTFFRQTGRAHQPSPASKALSRRRNTYRGCRESSDREQGGVVSPLTTTAPHLKAAATPVRQSRRDRPTLADRRGRRAGRSRRSPPSSGS